jgi:hypothetical protein
VFSCSRAQQAIAHRQPARQFSQAGNRRQQSQLLVQIKGSQILPDYFRHAHAQGGREILHGHVHLPLRRFQQIHQCFRQALHVARLK